MASEGELIKRATRNYFTRVRRTCLSPAQPANDSGIERHVGSNPPFLEETAQFWRAKYDSPLTAEDARTCIENVSGFFNVLQAWSLRATGSEPQSGDQEKKK